MVTLYFLNKIYSIFDSLVTSYFDPFIDFLNNSTGQLGALRVPVIVSDILRVSGFFLPVGTIGVLLGITCVLIIIQILHSFARWLVHLFGLI